MELDQTTISTITAILSSVFSSGVTYGVLKAKVEAMEKRLENSENNLEELRDKFVTVAHFESVTEPLQVAVVEIQKDIKKILELLIRGKK